MPTFRVNVKTQQKGAIFNKSATKAAAARMVIEINEAIAQEGVNRVLARLSNVLQHPTGYYESNITVARRATYRGVTDSGVPYGGWLEGVDSRNKTSRFKGYNTFRIVRSSLVRDKERIAQPLVDRFIAEMKG
jgi:hypothetical protein